jgi:uncharacterized protein YcnI
MVRAEPTVVVHHSPLSKDQSVMSPRIPQRARATAVVLAAASLTLVGGAAAQAHVRVIPESTAGGSFTKFTFRVPNESDTASTTKLVVSLPADTPLAFLSAQHLDGWKVSITKSKLATPVEVEGTTITEAATKVTWVAEKGSEVAPGEFQEFSLSGGPLPTDVKALSFPAEQTYSDGTVANWNEPQAEGAEEPEHPLPSFALTAALPEGADADAAPPAAAAPAAPAASGEIASENKNDSLARGLGIGGLLAGLIGLALGLLAWRRSSASGGGTASAATSAPVTGNPAPSAGDSKTEPAEPAAPAAGSGSADQVGSSV